MTYCNQCPDSYGIHSTQLVNPQNCSPIRFPTGFEQTFSNLDNLDAITSTSCLKKKKNLFFLFKMFPVHNISLPHLFDESKSSNDFDDLMELDEPSSSQSVASQHFINNEEFEKHPLKKDHLTNGENLRLISCEALTYLLMAVNNETFEEQKNRFLAFFMEVIFFFLHDISIVSDNYQCDIKSLKMKTQLFYIAEHVLCYSLDILN